MALFAAWLPLATRVLLLPLFEDTGMAGLLAVALAVMDDQGSLSIYLSLSLSLYIYIYIHMYIHRRYESFDTFRVHVENDFGVN